MGLQGEKTAAWFKRADAVLVNGVSSGFRYWGQTDTMVIDRGEGAYVYDMDGKRYIDLQNGFGPIILGHGHETVSRAAAEAASEGIVFAMTQRREIEAAEVFLEAVPWADRLRFTNTGTEATMHALRLARGLTGREVILKFEGQYHGAHDYVLFSTAGGPPGAMGSRLSPVPWQSSSGIPEGIRSYVRTLPYNDLELAEAFFRSHGHNTAAVIVEPMLGNLYGMMPAGGFLEGLRRLCNEHGTLLIFDEVKTGFRIALGGAQEHFGVTPDIGTFAKAMGNGFPVAAIALRGTTVEGWRLAGIMQAGTYSGNGVAVAAARATIETLRDSDALAHLDRIGTTLMDGVAKILADRGVPAHVMGMPSMFGIFLAEAKPVDFRDVGEHDGDLYDRIARAMIERGVFPCDDAREPWFLSAALTDEDVATILAVFEEALSEALG
ncbi:MAG: glutamate-1-semialdehyde 2,1-aminomutase [Acidimicrobiia bacterium]|nr:glutamate-1-semialdehyde 2,1-aminomutase [Acidimicrobiia bacterium]